MMTAQLTTSHTTAGNYPYVGVYWWEYQDQPTLQYASGLVTPSDNAYDGQEPVAGRVACSVPIQSYTCGSEPVPTGSALAWQPSTSYTAYTSKVTPSTPNGFSYIATTTGTSASS